MQITFPAKSRPGVGGPKIAPCLDRYAGQALVNGPQGQRLRPTILYRRPSQ